MRQEELFLADKFKEQRAQIIPGFRLVADYITEEEQELIAHIDAQQWDTNYQRRTQQYGFGYAGGSSNSGAWLRDFPPFLLPLARRISRGTFDRLAENCVINEY